MPNGDPRDRFFYPTLTLMIDSYNLEIMQAASLELYYPGSKQHRHCAESLVYGFDVHMQQIKFSQDKPNITVYSTGTVKPVLSGHS